MNEAVALMPCPFCGSEDIDARSGGSPECSDCGASACNSDWNTRAISAMGGVQVKPLKWEKDEAWRYRGMPTVALGGFCKNVMSSEHPDGDWYVAGQGRVRYGTLEDAKAAAQADYEKRILSALTPSPVSVEGWQSIRTALCLLNSMVRSGESHSDASELAFNEALSALPAAPQEGGE